MSANQQSYKNGNSENHIATPSINPYTMGHSHVRQ